LKKYKESMCNFELNLSSENEFQDVKELSIKQLFKLYYLLGLS